MQPIIYIHTQTHTPNHAVAFCAIRLFFARIVYGFRIQLAIVTRCFPLNVRRSSIDCLNHCNMSTIFFSCYFYILFLHLQHPTFTCMCHCCQRLKFPCEFDLIHQIVVFRDLNSLKILRNYLQIWWCLSCLQYIFTIKKKNKRAQCTHAKMCAPLSIFYSKFAYPCECCAKGSLNIHIEYL